MRASFIALIRSSIFRNSLYPMLAAGVTALFGFIFWLIATHLYATAEVGTASALISILGTIGTFALVGFDTSIVRYLANEEHKNTFINTSITVVGAATVLIAGGFVLLSPFISPALASVIHDTATGTAFIIFAVCISLNIFTDAVFLAYRRTQWTLIINTAFSVVKVALPLVFINGGAFGILSAAAIAQCVGLVLSIAVLMHRFSFRPRLAVDRTIMRAVWQYGLANYLADLFTFLPYAVLPILVVNTLGPTTSAYYYIVSVVSGLLFMIPASVTRALFSEGSYRDTVLRDHVKTALATIILLLLPAMLTLFIAGEQVLFIFGASYSSEGVGFLSIMTGTAVLVALSTLYAALFRITRDFRALFVRNVLFSIGTIGIANVYVHTNGLEGIGYAFAGGTALATLGSAVMYHVRAALSDDRIHGNGRLGRFAHLGTRIRNRVNETLVWPLKIRTLSSFAFLRALRARRYVWQTIVCYPERPHPYHALFKICRTLGLSITSRSSASTVCAIRFEDTTHATPVPEMQYKYRGPKEVINMRCTDISKSHVDRVFREVFGYGTALDPRTHEGMCVRKPERNASDEGTLVHCPTEPQDGYLYQRLINTVEGECAEDLRLYVFGNAIPIILQQYKRTGQRFHGTVAARFAPPQIISNEERALVLRFAAAMGLDYGEIDALRDRDDGKLYIVDVNTTPFGPVDPLYANPLDLARWYRETAHAFKTAFIDRASVTTQ